MHIIHPIQNYQTLIFHINPNLLCNPFKHIHTLKLYTFQEYAKYKKMGDKGEIILYAK